MDLFEEKIIQECKKGKKEAFDVLIRKYADKVYNIVLPMIQNSEDAKDVSQEVFIKVYKNIPSFQGNSNIGTWIYSIAVNSSKDYLRKKKSIKEMPLKENEISESSDPLDNLESKETHLMVTEALELLQENEKEILVLKDIMGFTYEEISGILEINHGTVKSRLSRARSELRDKLLTNKEFI